MYSGKGLQTLRGSATNGYVQSNRFSARGKAAGFSGEKFAVAERTTGEKKVVNDETAERARKREKEIKLLALEEELIDQGYSDADVVERVAEARRSLGIGSGND